MYICGKALKAMKYSVVMKQDLPVLIAAVNKMIGQGWKPQGGIGLEKFTENYPIKYLQAMIKEA